jgi:Tfp pilus assembly protein PilN
MEHQKLLFIEHDRIRTYQEGVFGEPSARGLKELPSGAIVPLSLLNTHTLKLSDRLSNDELRIQVEIRMFEEGNLNSDEEYTIDFIRHSIAAEESALVEVFALSQTKANEYFGPSLAKCGAIDQIIPGFMIYGALYPALTAQNDLFIYWGEEEAYAAIYQEGRYIAHRSIETLAAIAVDTGLDLPKLKHYLQTKGVVEENYPPEELNKYILLQDKIAKNIERIIHTINHKRGLFGLSGIDQCYLDFEGESIPGLKSVFSAYGISDIAISPLKREGCASADIHDALCADAILESKEGSLNLSPYVRKAPWYARESGKFLGIVGGALLITLAASLYTGWMVSSEKSRQEMLSAELETLKKETAVLSATLQKNNARLHDEQTKTAFLQNEIALYHGAEETAVLIHDMHVSRQQFLLDTTAELGRYRLGALLMEQTGSKEMNLHVVADYRKRDDIAKLMRGLYVRGYQDVQTHEIKLENNDTTYNSLVKVTR